MYDDRIGEFASKKEDLHAKSTEISIFSDTFTLSHAFVGQINRIASIRERSKEAQNEGAILLSLIS